MDNNSEGGAKCVKVLLCNEWNSDSYNDINEEMYYVEILRGSKF